MKLKFFLRTSNEYLVIYADQFDQTNFARVDAKTFDTLEKGTLFGEEIKYFIFLDYNFYIYIFNNHLITEKNGQRNRVKFGGEYHDIHDQFYNGKSLLVGTIYDNDEAYSYDAQLYLFKEPYNEISKTIAIENTKNFKLIGLKDYFIFIKIGDEDSSTKSQVNYIYYILDLNLNIKNSLTFKYANYSEIKFSQLSENNKINEFIMCISYYKSIIECKIIICKDSYLNFSKIYQIFSKHDTDNKKDEKNFLLNINIFDEDKIGCYLLSNNNKYEYDYVTIMQYNNSQLNYYKNISDVQFESIRDYAKNYIRQIVMNGKDIGIVVSNREINFIYFSSVYLENTISLNRNELPNEFPIKEFIFPGIDTLFHFSFYEIPEDLKIYKNSIEIEKGKVFRDLNNFTYILKINHYFKDFYIKIKDHEDNHIYKINININTDTYISTYKERHKCIKSNLYDKINNIKSSNLYNSFRIGNDTDHFNLTFYMESKPKLRERDFYLNNYILNCTCDLDNIITCSIPLIMIPIYEIIHIYSFLSCHNLIHVGWFQIIDIFSTYDLFHYEFKNISKMYDPSEKITEYNPKMINYYYWFSCLAYSDNNNLGSNNYCRNILSTWKIVFNKEYRYDKDLTSILKDLLDPSANINLKKKN